MVDKIKINNKEYTSIGKYSDNNDGIYSYYPDSKHENWLEFLKESDLLIFIWVISSIYSDINYRSIFKETDLEHKIYKRNKKSIDAFCDKYFDTAYENHELKEIFEDFIFGKFSDYGNYKLINNCDMLDYSELQELIYLNPKDQLDQSIISKIQVDFDWENIFDQVFISSEYYKDFVKDINGLVKELKKSLEFLKSAI